jgi:hypothetical protein
MEFMANAMCKLALRFAVLLFIKIGDVMAAAPITLGVLVGQASHRSRAKT